MERTTAVWLSDGALVRSCCCGNRSEQRHWSGHRCRTHQEGAQSGRTGTQGGKGGGERAVSWYRLNCLCTKLWKCTGAWLCGLYLCTFLGTLADMKKSTAAYIMSVCPSARNKSVPTARIFVTFHIGEFQRNLFVNGRSITHLRQGAHKYFYDNISQNFFMKW